MQCSAGLVSDFRIRRIHMCHHVRVDMFALLELLGDGARNIIVATQFLFDAFRYLEADVAWMFLGSSSCCTR